MQIRPLGAECETQHVVAFNFQLKKLTSDFKNITLPYLFCSGLLDFMNSLEMPNRSKQATINYGTYKQSHMCTTEVT